MTSVSHDLGILTNSVGFWRPASKNQNLLRSSIEKNHLPPPPQLFNFCRKLKPLFIMPKTPRIKKARKNQVYSTILPATAPPTMAFDPTIRSSPIWIFLLLLLLLFFLLHLYSFGSLLNYPECNIFQCLELRLQCPTHQFSADIWPCQSLCHRREPTLCYLKPAD